MGNFKTFCSFVALCAILVSFPRGSDASRFLNARQLNATQTILSSISSSLTASLELSSMTTTSRSSGNISSTTETATTTTIPSSTFSFVTSNETLTVESLFHSTTSSTQETTSASWRSNSTTIVKPSATSTATISGMTAAPTVTLAPAIHWDHDLGDLAHIAPQESAKFYYAEQPGLSDPSVGGQFAHVTTNFTYPSVILEHSGLIDAVDCRPDPSDPSLIVLHISLASSEAYQSAKSNWTQHPDLVLITYIPGCGVSAEDQRAFWKTTSLSFDDSAHNITATGHEISLQETITEMDLEWGSYEPPPPNATHGYITVSDGAAMGLSANATSATCGTLSSSTIDGLPAAKCGLNFDQSLDDSIGYGSQRSKRSVERRIIGKRCHWYQVACLAREAWEAAQRLLKKVDPHWDPSVSKQVSFHLGPPSSGLVYSPYFGQAYKLFRYGDNQNYVAAYCVDCGVQGNVRLWGRASIALLEGITSAQVGMDGNLHAALYFGIEALGSTSTPAYQQALWSAGIPGLSVPGIYSVGPMVSVGAEMSLGVQAGGQVLMGAAMDWPNFSVSLDLVHPSSSQFQGLQPITSSKFLAAGQITAQANIGFPIAVGIGLDIPVINFHKALEIVDKPGLSSSVTFKAGNSPVSGLTGGCNNGISSATYFTNDVYVSLFDLKRWNIFNYKSSPLFRNCYLFRARDDEEVHTPEEPRTQHLPSPSHSRREAGNDTMLPNSTSSLPPNGTTYSSIVDMDLVYQLSAGSDGNLYLEDNGGPQGTLFALNDNSSLADASGRGFHYYQDEMAKYGVSRFRLSNPATTPKTAQPAALVLLGDIQGKFPRPVFGVVDSLGSINYPVVCDVVGQIAKIFLVADIENGLQKLMAEGLRNTITGGEVSKCNVIPLTVGLGAPVSK